MRALVLVCVRVYVRVRAHNGECVVTTMVGHTHHGVSVSTRGCVIVCVCEGACTYVCLDVGTSVRM